MKFLQILGINSSKKKNMIFERQNKHSTHDET